MTSRFILCVWISYLASAGYLLWNDTRITSDLTFFLPKSNQAAEELLLKIAQDGPGSHMMLAEVRGGTQRQRFEVIDALVQRLREIDLFSMVQSGSDPRDLLRLEDRLYPYRFILSDPTPGQWEPSHLHQRLQDRLEELYSAAGRLGERWIGTDPLGQWTQYLKRISSGPQPIMVGGHWVEASGNSALMLIETRAAGFDLSAQQQAQVAVRSAFDAIPHPGLSLGLGGAGAVAVETNSNITREATWLSLANTLMVSGLMLFIYRSFRILALGMIPLLTGVITGALAIRLHSGGIHAITLGFGSTLLGVAADYPNHFFTHLSPSSKSLATMKRLWPTLRLGILTNIAGFGVMFFSGFKGLQEIGVFAAAGLLGAGVSTRFVLPVLSSDHSGIANWLSQVADLSPNRITRKVRRVMGVLLTISFALLFAVSGRSLFNDDLATLNPVSPSRLDSDIQLQRAFRVPDMRWLILITGTTEEDALIRSERLRPALGHLVDSHAITGFEALSDLMPSQLTQKQRRDALPSPEAAKRALEAAIIGTPFKIDAFKGMVNDIAAAASLPPLNRESFRDTPLAQRVNAQIQDFPEGVAIVVSMEGITDVPAIQQTLKTLNDPSIQWIDLRESMSQRIRNNRIEAAGLLLLGLFAIVVILSLGLQSLRLAIQVFMPMLFATLSTGFLMAVIDNGLNIYHLASMLLVMGLSLDQALFFNRPCVDPDERARTHLSILVCSLSSILAFGGLAFSSIPLLTHIGSTVSIGAFLAITFSALLANSSDDPR